MTSARRVKTVTMGQSVAFISGKGGTGKTALTAGVGSCLASLGARVVCIDADFGLRNLDLVLGLAETMPFDLSDILMRDTPVSDALAKHPNIDNLHFIAAPLHSQPVDEDRLKLLIQALCTQFDFVLVDVASGLGENFSRVVRCCDRAVVVTLPETASLRDAVITAQTLDNLGLSENKLVLNRVGSHVIRQKYYPNADDAMDATGLPLLGVVPDDLKVSLWGNRGISLILMERTGAARAYLNIARRMMGNKVPVMKF